MKRSFAVLLPIAAVVASSFLGGAATGCGGACCDAVCVPRFSISLTGPGGTALQEFHGTWTIDGAAPVPVHCTASTHLSGTCTGFGVDDRTPAEVQLDLDSALDGASFHGVVDLDYSKETECCDTCDVARESVELIATP